LFLVFVLAFCFLSLLTGYAYLLNPSIKKARVIHTLAAPVKCLFDASNLDQRVALPMAADLADPLFRLVADSHHFFALYGLFENVGSDFDP
jgi:hypothetical protein